MGQPVGEILYGKWGDGHYFFVSVLISERACFINTQASSLGRKQFDVRNLKLKSFVDDEQ